MYCKLYVNMQIDVDAIAKIVESLYSGTHRFGLFKSQLFEVDIEKNEEASQALGKPYGDGFLYFPIIMTFESQMNTDDKTFKEIIEQIMRRLQADRALVIAACDFEEELPQSYDTRAVN